MNYGYGGIPVASTEEERLYEKMLYARRALDDYNYCLKQPVASFAWEGAVHSNVTRESLQRNLEKAEAAYYNYWSKKSGDL